MSASGNSCDQTQTYSYWVAVTARGCRPCREKNRKYHILDICIRQSKNHTVNSATIFCDSFHQFRNVSCDATGLKMTACNITKWRCWYPKFGHFTVRVFSIPRRKLYCSPWTRSAGLGVVFSGQPPYWQVHRDRRSLYLSREMFFCFFNYRVMGNCFVLLLRVAAWIHMRPGGAFKNHIP